MPDRSSSMSPLLAAAAVVAIPILLLAYLVAYIGFCDGEESLSNRASNPDTVRIYRQRWQVAVFRPAAWMESAAFHRKVDVVCVLDRVQ